MSQQVDVPAKILREAHTAFKKMARQRTIVCETRAGVLVEFDRTSEACQKTLTEPLYQPIRGGSRVRTTRGEGTIIGKLVLGVSSSVWKFGYWLLDVCLMNRLID